MEKKGSIQNTMDRFTVLTRSVLKTLVVTIRSTEQVCVKVLEVVAILA